MARSLLLSFLLFFTSFIAFGQVGIGTTTPDPSAQLDIVSAEKGLLIPRVTSTSSVASPVAKGLVVYQTTGSEGFYYFDGTAWQKLITASEAPSATYAYAANPGIHTILPGMTEPFPDTKSSGFTTGLTTLSPDKAGTYLFSYQTDISFSTAPYNTVVKVNGSPIPGSIRKGTGSSVTLQSAHVIADLPANAVVTLEYELTGFFIEINNSSLTIIRLK